MKSLEEQFRFTQSSCEPEHRSRFLSSLFSLARDREENRAFMESLVYDERIPQECLEQGVLPIMRTDIPLLARFHHPGSKSFIRVFPRAFAPDIHATLDEFCSTLFDHEGWHAREHARNPEIIVEYLHPEFIRHSTRLQAFAAVHPSRQSAETVRQQASCDIRAYDYQLLRISQGVRSVSPAFIDAIEYERSMFLHWLSVNGVCSVA